MPNKKGEGPTIVHIQPGGVNGSHEDAFHNDGDWTCQIKFEKAWHRQAIELALRGYTHGEIATAVGKSRPSVAIVLRQPWARKLMIKRAKTDTYTEMKQLLEGAGPSSLARILEFAEKAKNTKNGFIADTYIVDHLLGKATQPIQTERKEPTPDMSDEELAAIAKDGVAVPIVHEPGSEAINTHGGNVPEGDAETEEEDDLLT